MTPAYHDEVRAAAVLLAIAARGRRGRGLRAVVLDADPDTDRSAAIAVVLAEWLAEVLRDAGTDPVWFAKQVIAESIGVEAAETREAPARESAEPEGDT